MQHGPQTPQPSRSFVRLLWVSLCAACADVAHPTSDRLVLLCVMTELWATPHVRGLGPMDGRERQRAQRQHKGQAEQWNNSTSLSQQQRNYWLTGQDPRDGWSLHLHHGL
jgi:hypothetical protein